MKSVIIETVMTAIVATFSTKAASLSDDQIRIALTR